MRHVKIEIPQRIEIPHFVDSKLTALLVFAFLAAAAIVLAAPAMADELPEAMEGRWCSIASEWDSAAFSMFIQSECNGKDGTGLALTKTTLLFFGPEPQRGFPNSHCTIEKVTKLEDDHYLVDSTCKEHGGPDASHPYRGEPYENGQILFLDTCGRLQSKNPELCDPHCDPEPPPEACKVS